MDRGRGTIEESGNEGPVQGLLADTLGLAFKAFPRHTSALGRAKQSVPRTRPCNTGV